ncbi:hypothetical protein WM11_28975 [Burkholderia ubonensis]|nr:hypothetical protein WJ99_17605 [Burkholderia ubonensis]KVQ20022.1 hypothetical protein WK00_26520 [Burkholderia ubonensis]KVR62423.1 hypothetical protein WK20_12730 [Burkholderia ubonensis]KWI92766.1 hypothetical protein WM10_13530 [Burkholderia ubonensis]KWK14048.1 hypothetical protein WM11_28975 [Burkholderia ubonensis]
MSVNAVVNTLWSLRKYRGLTLQMVKREVLGRYRGSIMGLAWSFFNPLLLLVVYTFVFAVVFKARWSGDGEHVSHTEFAVILFVGMMVHGLFAECVNRAPTLILNNVTYVKKVVFPLEILPLVAMGSALFHMGVSFIVLLVAEFLIVGAVPWTVIYLPLVLLPLVFASIGVAWFLAALGVYVRDIAQATSLFTTILAFLSPIFYPISALPPRFQVWMRLNPLTYVIEEARRTAIFGHSMNWMQWLIYMAFGAVIAVLGLLWFQKTRKGFADVL